MNAASKEDSLLRELKKLWKNGLFRSLFLVLLVVLGVFIFREALVFVLKTEYPLETPISRSMEPTLNIGDMLIVQGGLNGDEIYAHESNGDIIVYRDPRNPNTLIVHRVIEKFKEDSTWYFITKGDNNPTRDRWFGFPRQAIPECYLIGRVIWRIPLLGYVKIYLGTPLGTVISILLLVALLFLENMTSSERVEKPQSMGEKIKGS